MTESLRWRDAISCGEDLGNARNMAKEWPHASACAPRWAAWAEHDAASGSLWGCRTAEARSPDYDAFIPLSTGKPRIGPVASTLARFQWHSARARTCHLLPELWVRGWLCKGSDYGFHACCYAIHRAKSATHTHPPYMDQNMPLTRFSATVTLRMDTAD